jgi:hypothetical protein
MNNTAFLALVILTISSRLDIIVGQKIWENLLDRTAVSQKLTKK